MIQDAGCSYRELVMRYVMIEGEYHPQVIITVLHDPGVIAYFMQ